MDAISDEEVQNCSTTQKKIEIGEEMLESAATDDKNEKDKGIWR